MIVRKLRLEKGLSQEQLAGMAGISTRTLQRIERGAKASPETLKCIAAVLETEFSSLRREQDMQTPPTAAAPEPSEEEQDAMQYARDIRAFYTHAIQYAVVIAALLILNLLTSPGHFWVVWPALGWGIGLAIHGFSVFEVIGLFGQDWEDRQIARRLKSRRNRG
ncbi:2TM domain-containing protein [Phaeobacter italicus]|uniref:2TM domain-containing protein n=1 Tax=Phaeobacter italicus TaxID=481446 RepID=UPI001CD4583B|nr:helix-turn-helix domain-containing protein [Phaeobacter italicus]MCA0855398.1 helix-turn-helix domain-containing protein [Phaeobacter italicus]